MHEQGRGLVVATLCVPIGRTLPLTIDARADYGIEPWRGGDTDRRTRSTGRAGFNAFPANGHLVFLVERVMAGESGGETNDLAGLVLRLTVDGYPLQTLYLPEAVNRVTIQHPRGRAFVELATRDAVAEPFDLVVLDYPAGRSR